MLPEGAPKEVLGLFSAVVDHEVSDHVVGGAKRRAQRVLTAADEPGDRVERHERGPQDQGVSLGVHPPSAGPPGELGELARGEDLVALAGEPRQTLDHHAPGRQVDPHRQRLGGKDDAYQTGSEELLCDLLEQREHAGVVCGDAAFESFPPGVHPEDPKVLGGQPGESPLDR